MSQRTDERDPTRIELECYNKLLKLSDHTLSVCKPKDKNVNNKHIAKRHASIGHKLEDIVIDMGADILEANEIYVNSNLNVDTRKKNYRERIKLQNHAKQLTYRMEHIIRILHYNRPFADSTITYWMNLLVETRQLIKAWRDSDIRELSKIKEK